MDKQLIQRQTSLSANVIAFCRYLRDHGFFIGPREELDSLSALELLAPYQDADIFQDCLRATLARTPAQQRNFASLYQKYWRELDKALDSKIKDAEKEAKKEKTQAPSLEALKNWLFGNQSEETTDHSTYSATVAQGRKDFSGFSDDELREIMQLIRVMTVPLSKQYNRRQRSAKTPGAFDLRSTLRQNLRRGGEIVQLAYRKPKKRRIRLVLLCDVSKSMDLYSRFLLQFMYAFRRVVSSVEAFVFSTSLHRISAQLDHRDFVDILDELADTVPGWSGGTRIGASLDTFNQDYSHRLVDRNTIVLIMSDGWDTGETELLADSMAYLKRKAGRIIWLNPLAGSPGYQPSVGGMQTALPYVDVFAPAYDLASLRKVVHLL